MTRLFGVIGHPISHSLSPVMHTAAFRAWHSDALYSPFEVSLRDLRPMLQGLIRAGVEGLNVTVPLKEAVVPLLQDLAPSARILGAVNTIVIRRRRAVGHNTDGFGFRMALKELGWKPHRCQAIVLGAGGAARAVAWELTAVSGSHLTLVNRHLKRAQNLAVWLRRKRPQVSINILSLDQLQSGSCLENAELLVNATTVGMNVSDPVLISPRMLRSGMLVYDLIYHHETPLIRQARQRRCVATNGLSMLLYQAVQSLSLWLHRPVPVEAMRRALVKALKSVASD